MSILPGFALAYAGQGWAVFPLKARDKIPANEDGFKSATKDLGRIEAYWSKHPQANIGIATGAVSGILVIDVDKLEGLDKLEKQHGSLPETTSAETGSGGRHLIFQHPGREIRNRAKFIEGLDVRGDGGYIVVPPSIHPNGKPYRWLREGKPSEAPQWLLELIRKPEIPRSPLPIILYKGDGIGTAWGQAVLEGESARVVQAPQGERHTQLFAAACQVYGAVKGGQLEQNVATDRLRSAAIACGLPQDKELDHNLANAWERAESRQPPERVQLPPVPKLQPKPMLRKVYRPELDTIPPPEWLIEGILTTGFSVLFGPSGHGKSFLALDWSLSVATGHEWFGKYVARRRVLYVAAEGTSGIPRRVKAWEKDRGARGDDFVLIPQVVNLLQKSDVKLLEEAVQKDRAQLLVVDTLARSMPGGDENAAQDMGRLVDVLTRIQSTHDCAILLIHHTGVEGIRPRGSTALRGAADTMIRTDLVDDRLKITCDKQKDDDAFAPWHLRMKPIDESIVLSSATERSMEKEKQYVLERLKDCPPLSYAKLLELGDKETIAQLLASRAIIPAKPDRNGARYQLGNMGSQQEWEVPL